MKKLLLNIAVTAAVVAGGSLALAPSSASAATACDAIGIGSNPKTLYTEGNTAYKVANGKVTITFNVTGKNCHLPVTMVSWTAPNPTNGMPYSQQHVYDQTTAYFSEGLHQLTVKLPNCYYQIDTVTGPKMVSGKGDLKERMVGYIHGGTQSCTAKPPVTPTPPKTPTPTPVTPTPPQATGGVPTAVAMAQPTKLTNTGPVSNAIIGVVAASIIGGYVFAQKRARRQTN